MERGGRRLSEEEGSVRNRKLDEKAAVGVKQEEGNIRQSKQYTTRTGVAVAGSLHCCVETQASPR